MNKNIALLLAGGTGARVGSGIPKQYLKVGQTRVLTYSARTLLSAEELGGLVIVAAEDWRDVIWHEIADVKTNKIINFTLPGESRQGSIRNGLRRIHEIWENAETVLIHDAARPNLTQELITACYEALPGHDGVMPVLPMKDTVYLSDEAGGKVESLLPRERVFAGQAPELYRFEKYFAINEGLTDEELNQIHGSTEPAIHAGLDIALVDGDENNFKITTASDLARFRALIEAAK